MARRRWVRWVVGTMVVLGTAGVAAAADTTWYTNSWKAAQTHVGFPLRYPPSVFKLKPELTKGKLIRVTGCAGQSTGSAVWAEWGRPGQRRVRDLWFAQTNVQAPGWPCSNQGIAGPVKTVSIHGNKAYVTAYCSPALKATPMPPSCSSRWVSFDLTWHEGKAWIRAESYGFDYGDLVAWARRLSPVR